MISLKLLAGIMHDCREFKGEWHKTLDEIASGQPEEVASVLAGFGKPLKGVVGQIVYDLTGSCFGRVEAGIMSAEAAKIMTGSDSFIDETEPELQVKEKIDAVRTLFETIETGELQEFGYAKLTAISLLCLDLYKRMSKNPHNELFLEECKKLSEAVIEQIEGNASFDVSYRIGSGTAAVINIIPYCFDDRTPQRFIEAARNMGAYCQILDDMRDYRHDLRRGIATVFTASPNLNETKKEALAKAFEYRKRCYDALETSSEKRVYETLEFLFNLRNKMESLKRTA